MLGCLQRRLREMLVALLYKRVLGRVVLAAGVVLTGQCDPLGHHLAPLARDDRQDVDLHVLLGQRLGEA